MERFFRILGRFFVENPDSIWLWIISIVVGVGYIIYKIIDDVSDIKVDRFIEKERNKYTPPSQTYTSEDIKKKDDDLEDKVKQGDPDAKCELGVQYLYGICGHEKDEVKGWNLIETSAKQGCKRAKDLCDRRSV